MYHSAVNYLQPVQNFAKICGLHPLDLTDHSVAYFYIFCCSLMVIIPTKHALNYGMMLFTQYNDIVLFTNMLHIICTRAMHNTFIYIPLVKTKLYKKLFKKLSNAEKLIHSLNMKQQETPAKLWQYLFILFLAATHILLFGLFFVQGRITLQTACVVALDFVRFNSYMLQINCLLYAVLSKYTLINWHLEYLNNKVPAYLMPPEDKEFIARKVNAEGVEQKFVDYSVNTRMVFAAKIRTINQIHFLLSSCCSRINEYFSVQNCMAVLQSALHTMHLSVAIFDVKSVEGLTSDIYAIVVTYNYMWWVFIVAKLCHLIKTEVSKKEKYIFHRINIFNCLHICNNNILL